MGSRFSSDIIYPWEALPGMPEEKLDEIVEAELFPYPKIPINRLSKELQEYWRGNPDRGIIEVTRREYRMVKAAVDHAIKIYKNNHPEVTSNAEALRRILEEWEYLRKGQQVPAPTPVQTTAKPIGYVEIGRDKSGYKMTIPGAVMKMIQDDTQLQSIGGIRCRNVDAKSLLFSFESKPPPPKSARNWYDLLTVSKSGKKGTVTIKKVIAEIPKVAQGTIFPDGTYSASVENGTLRVAIDVKAKP